jgi:hypothetical protein
MILSLITLFLATSFPSSTRTSWMAPESFRLVIGMSRIETQKALENSGWTVRPGRNEDEAIVDYADDKAMTLEFNRERLHSVRFELFAFIPEVRQAFKEQQTLLRKTHGAPKKTLKTKSVVLYDDRLPNIMVVLSDDPKSEYGRKGLGYLAVRYYDPLPPR